MMLFALAWAIPVKLDPPGRSSGVDAAARVIILAIVFDGEFQSEGSTQALIAIHHVYD